ncbi:uncharacterized protein BJ212DRAFT_1304681 [Suillus subaureus]|uniref:CxC2-like cysteine cluster KDZ transposase-associated domain-containing protein n=1 Tax=Suillus subaureus TaxID=48587 RepID=A0A9P7DUF3_9AGAM|nr:uncharacterized protein BJ212DRAFT_1304681 [Suillus subaureus]KAG1803116.1 hypothetical protein BJ212DRAFT_1304681 [Suillus subaureus]
MEDMFAQEEGDTINDMQLGVSNLVIVHSTGVYSHSVSWCQCPGAEKAQHLHLMKARLFPASITCPQSAFTFNVLDNFLIDALECKTSAMSFYQKLRRLTNNAFPDKIPDKKDQYRELMIWSIEKGSGDLALYCPACPQPGINLPTSWRYDYEDMSLIIGLCNHRAVNATNVQRSNLRATGVGATACARHGCFVPHAVVDFQKGEQHTNMDYSICNAVKYTPKHIGSMLIIYDVASLQGVSDTQGPYEELTRSLDLDNVQEWKKAAEKAAQDCGELLDIYQLKMDKAPSMAEIRLRLTENELSANGRTGSVAWLIEGINIENSQQLPQDLTASQRTTIEERRQKLMAWIIKFHEAAEVMTNGIELKGGEGAPLDNPELCLEEADTSNMEGPEEEDILDFDGNIDSPAEVTKIWMPSWTASGHIMDDVILALGQEELKLQKGQANNCLEKLHQALGDRSVVFQEKIHSNKSVHHQGTRSKKELRMITLSINRHAKGYSWARAAMLCLGADSDTVAVYQPIKPQDLVFWRINNAKDSQKNIWMNELNWLKAKAWYNHWSEELKLTQKERWRVWADESIKNGNRAYAERQASMWAEFSAQGLKNFEGKLLITS